MFFIVADSSFVTCENLRNAVPRRHNNKIEIMLAQSHKNPYTVIGNAVKRKNR